MAKKKVKRKVTRKRVAKKTTKKKVTKRKVTRKRVAKKTTKKRKTTRKKAPVRRKPTVHYAPRIEEKPTPLLGIIVLLLNALVLPGLGSLIGKKVNSGLLQLILAILGQLFIGKLVHNQIAVGMSSLGALGVIGLVLIVVSWVWGIISGIDVIRKSI